MDCFLGDQRDVSVQLFCLSFESGGKLRHAFDLSWNIGRAEYCPGFSVCSWFSLGRGGSGGRNGDRPVWLRPWDRDLYVETVPAAENQPASYGLESPDFERDRKPFLFNMYSAVGDEFRHFAGSGACQQLWGRGDGGVRSCGEDRFFRLHAGAGVRQCVFHIYCAELRGQKT